MEYDINDLDLPVEERDRALAWLRENDPVHWDEKNGYWLVTRHADVMRVSKNAELFSSVPKGPWHVFDGSGVSIQALDGPEHHAKRRLVSGLFTPRMVRRLEALARQVIDPVAEPDCFEHLDGAAPRLVTRNRSLELQPHLDVLAGRQRGEQVVRLEDETDVLSGFHERARARPVQLMPQHRQAAVLHGPEGSD